VQFSPDVVSRLADRIEATEPTPERQSILDAHVRARIHDELEHLKKEEEHVRQEIERALERENLDREKSMAGEALEGDRASVGDVKNSAALLGDLEEVRIKVERYHTNRNMSEFPGIDASSAALVECYRLIFFFFQFVFLNPFMQKE